MAAARTRVKSKLEAARTRMYRELVFESAERVFAASGFEEATMQAIAADAGISLKTLYTAFPGKNELYREIHDVRNAEFFAFMVERRPSSGSPLSELEYAVAGYTEFLFSHEPYFRILLREGRSWGLGPAHGNETSWRAGLALLANMIRAGMEAGLFYPGDPELMAATALAVLQVQLAGLLDRARRGSRKQSAEVDPAPIQQELLTQMKRLLCVPGEVVA